jgi:predicted transcriptional regulator
MSEKSLEQIYQSLEENLRQENLELDTIAPFISLFTASHSPYGLSEEIIASFDIKHDGLPMRYVKAFERAGLIRKTSDSSNRECYKATEEGRKFLQESNMDSLLELSKRLEH